MIRQCLTLFCLATLLCPAAPGQTPERQSELVIPEGTEIQLSLRDPLSSKLSEVGDEVQATVRRDVVANGRTLLRQGTEVIGRVTVAERAGRLLKGGKLHVTFERVRVGGQEQRLSAIIKSASDFTRDEKIKSDSEGTLKQGASGGQVVQNMVTAGALGGLGATIIILASADRNSTSTGLGRGLGISRGGAIAGAGVIGGSMIAGVLLTRGKEVRLDPGAIVRLRLERPLAVE